MSDTNEALEQQQPQIKTGKDYWVETISQQKMPALASTVHKLSRLTTDADSCVSQLSDEILKDPSLTSRILQIASSVGYRGVAGSCTTISRAIVLMGFTSIRDISISMKILDEMLKNNPSIHLKNVLAKSFHAAMQASWMVTDKKYGMQEEVFISGLLYHIGEMSLLSRDDDLSRQLDLLISGGMAPDQAGREVLGVSFTDLSKGLADQWQLSPVLVESLRNQGKPTKPAQAVLFGEELSQVAALGWDSDEVMTVIKKIAKFTRQDLKKVLEYARSVADNAKEVSSMYGAESVQHLIPPSSYTTETAEQLNVVTLVNPEVEETTFEDGTIMPAQPAQKVVELDITPEMIEAALNYRPLGSCDEPEDSSDQQVEQQRIVQPHSIDASDTAESDKPVADASLQLEYMSRIGDLLSSARTDVNEVFKVILDGMENAVGLNRVVMCLLTRDRRNLLPRSYRGDISEALFKEFAFSVLDENAFSYALHQAQPIWLGSKRMQGRDYLVTESILKHIQTIDFFVAPIVVSRRPVGIFYGDMKGADHPLSEMQFVNFNSLAQQASIALSSVS